MRRFWRTPSLAAICWLIGFWALAAALAGGQARPPEAQATQAQGAAPAKPAGTGKISGRVVAADNGAPVKRATVMLRGGTLQVSSTGRGSGSGTPSANVEVMARGSGNVLPPGIVEKSREVDAAGRFEFTDLPEGRFTLNVNTQSGFGRTSQIEPVQLAAGGSAAVTIRLERTGVITGKVFDETGDPLPRAILRATRWDSSGGVRRLTTTSGGGFNMTNDLGEYRLWDVPPGDYYVSASYMPGNYTPPTSEREDPRFGYAPTFFPGIASMDGARTVTVRPGQETPGVDIALQRARMGRVAATVFDSAGGPLSQRSNVYLASRHDSYGATTGMSRRPDGSYLSGDVPPGDYYLVANQGQGESPAAAATSEGAVVPVSVNGDEVTVTAHLNRGATVSGRVVVEGKMPEPSTVVTSVTGSQPVASQARIMVSARQATNPAVSYFPGSSSGRPAPMRDDGTFELTGLRGPFRLFASGNRAVLKSARRGGQDILTTPLELSGSEHITDVEIVVTTETGTIDFSVTNFRGEPAAGAFVLIFSDDAELWFEGSPYVRQARTPSAPGSTGAPSGGVGSGAPTAALGAGTGLAASGTNPREPGRLMSGALVPGRYGVIAFEPNASPTGPAFDPEAIEKMRSRATFVTVVAGEPATVQLKTVKQ